MPVVCALCAFRSEGSLIQHLRDVHPEVTPEDYLERYGDLVTAEVRAGVEGPQPPPRGNGKVEETLFCATRVHVHSGVEAAYTLPRPGFYREPSCGEAAEAARFVTLGLREGLKVFLYGSSGTGKDALIHAFSAATRRPTLKLQVMPGADVQAWLWSRALSAEGTSWEEGQLLKAARDGYTTQNGKRVPYLILLTDFDRAEESQAEIFRLLFDTVDGGRIPVPDGGSAPLFPGTQFVATANTAGSGDETGRYTSARAMDGSLLNRFDVVKEMPFLDWSDECSVLRQRHPLFARTYPALIPTSGTGKLGKATHVIRTKIRDQVLYGDFSHRDLSKWMQFTEILLREGFAPEKALIGGCKVVLDRFDATSRASLVTLLQGCVPGLMEEAVT